MSADTAAVLLVLGMAPAATLFPIVYGFTSPWWTTLIGRGLLISSLGLALLIDISLLYQWLGDDYALRDVVRLSVYGLIFAGVHLMLWGLLGQKLRGRREARRG